MFLYCYGKTSSCEKSPDLIMIIIFFLFTQIHCSCGARITLLSKWSKLNMLQHLTMIFQETWIKPFLFTKSKMAQTNSWADEPQCTLEPGETAVLYFSIINLATSTKSTASTRGNISFWQNSNKVFHNTCTDEWHPVRDKRHLLQARM